MNSTQEITSFAKTNAEYDDVIMGGFDSKVINYGRKWIDQVGKLDNLEAIRIEMLRVSKECFALFRFGQYAIFNDRLIVELSENGTTLMFNESLISVSQEQLCFIKKGDGRKFSDKQSLKFEETALTIEYARDLVEALSTLLDELESGIVLHKTDVLSRFLHERVGKSNIKSISEKCTLQDFFYLGACKENWMGGEKKYFSFRFITKSSLIHSWENRDDIINLLVESQQELASILPNEDVIMCHIRSGNHQEDYFVLYLKDRDTKFKIQPWRFL